MELEYLKALAALMDEHGLTDLEVQQGEDKVIFSKQAAPASSAQAMPLSSASQMVPAQRQSEEMPAAQTASATEKPAVKAPLVGCVYLAPAPDEAPFVEVGDTVKKGQTLCVVEAMKVMNEIPAPKDGVVAEICVKNGQVVEYGQPLFRLQ